MLGLTKKFVIIYFIFVLVIPFGIWGLYEYDSSRALIWFLIHQIYYAPVAFIFSEPFFRPDSEVSFWVLWPGRLLTIVIYSFIFLGVKLIWNMKIKKKEAS